MPEGHSIRALVDRWQAHAGERFTLTSPSGRTAGLGSIIDSTLMRADAKGKHLLLGFGSMWVHVHLGRFGKFHWHTGEVQPPATNVRLRLAGANMWVDLVGAITCQVLDEPQRDAVLAALGPDPLRGDDPAPAFERINATGRPIGLLLMDQHIIAGIGNIYRAEVLWRLQLDPYKPGRELTRAQFDALWQDTVLLLRDGVPQAAHGQATRTAEIPLPDGSRLTPVGDGNRGRCQVYGRDGLPCARCGTTVVRADMGGRNLFWCPGCQLI